MRIPVQIKGIPKCKYCKRPIDLDDSGWGLANDLISRVVFYYHIECFEIFEDVKI